MTMTPSTAGFTKGPWTRGRIRNAGMTRQCALHPAVVVTSFASSDAQFEENLSLLEAAPELYEALKRVIELRDLGHPKGGDLDANVAYRQAERDADTAARAALSKAVKP